MHETFDLKALGLGAQARCTRSLKQNAGCVSGSNLKVKIWIIRALAPQWCPHPKIVKKDSDVDWRFEIGDIEGASVSSALCADADFLCRQGIMDYSLIVGVERRRVVLTDRDRRRQKREKVELEKTDRETKLPHGRRLSTKMLSHYGAMLTMKKVEENTYEAAYCTAPGSYTFGVIDILQKFNLAKRAERCWKVYGPKRLNARGISCVEPEDYCERFKKRVAKALIAPLLVKHSSDAIRPQNEGSTTTEKVEKEKSVTRQKLGNKKHTKLFQHGGTDGLTLSLLSSAHDGSSCHEGDHYSSIDSKSHGSGTSISPLGVAREDSILLDVHESAVNWEGVKCVL